MGRVAAGVRGIKLAEGDYVTPARRVPARTHMCSPSPRTATASVPC